MNIIQRKLEANVSSAMRTCCLCVLFFHFLMYVGVWSQSSDDLDTDTEFEPVEDMTLETRSRCKVFVLFFFCFSNFYCFG